MYCPECGTQSESESLFCATCGTSLGSTQVPAQGGSPKKTRSKVWSIGIIGLIALLLAGVYGYMAWLPPTLAQSVEKIQSLNSYEQKIMVNTSSDTFDLTIKSDASKDLLSVLLSERGEQGELLLQGDRLIMGLPARKKYGAITLNQQSNFIEQKTAAYLKSVESDMDYIWEEMSKNVLKPNATTDFNHATVITPGGDINVKQYTVKMNTKQLADAYVAASTEVKTEADLRDHMTSAMNKTIDFALDTGGANFSSSDRTQINQARSEFINGLQEFGDSLDEQSEKDEFYAESANENVSIEIIMSWDYHNRPVEMKMKLQNGGEIAEINSMYYNFNKPVNISIPSESNIVRLNNFDGFGRLF